MTLTTGVPQEVSLAQFCVPFTAPNWEISSGNQVEAQVYADDQQIYQSFRPIRNNNTPETVHCGDQNLDGIQSPELNDYKTEFLLF